MRLHLVVEGGSLSGTETDLEQGSLQLGRAPDCNLQFSPFIDTRVSKYHAIIVANADGFYVADQQSTNGTLLNGTRVERSWLSDGDVIELGAGGPKLRVTLLPDKRPEPVPQPAPEPEVTGKSLRQTFRNLGYFDPQKDKRARHMWEYGGLIIAGLLFLSWSFCSCPPSDTVEPSPAPSWPLSRLRSTSSSIYGWIVMIPNPFGRLREPSPGADCLR